MSDEPKAICCVCQHKLDSHLSEGEHGWRCHAIAPDGFQCECWLRAKTVRIGNVGHASRKLQDYDMAVRSERHGRELEGFKAIQPLKKEFPKQMYALAGNVYSYCPKCRKQTVFVYHTHEDKYACSVCGWSDKKKEVV